MNDARGLAQRQLPEGQPALRSAQVHFQQIVTEPSPTDWSSPWLEGLDLDADDEARISEAAGRREADGYWGHLGGHPHVIQNAMEAECEKVSSGFGPEDRDAAGAAEVLREAERKARDWRLLLQLPSYEALGWEWGSGMGLLYFWIRKDDLARRDFSRVWLILQTT